MTAVPSGRARDFRTVEQVRVAEPAEAGQLLTLREQAAAWLTARGVRQWEPGEVGIEVFRAQVQAGQWHVLRDGSGLVGALRLLGEDELIWGPQPPVAAYVHGLMVAEQHRGLGVGVDLLRWAAHQARVGGRSLLRLDCSEENQALRRYYSRQGFRAVGRREFDGPWYSVALLERAL